MVPFHTSCHTLNLSRINLHSHTKGIYHRHQCSLFFSPSCPFLSTFLLTSLVCETARLSSAKFWTVSEGVHGQMVSLCYRPMKEKHNVKVTISILHSLFNIFTWHTLHSFIHVSVIIYHSPVKAQTLWIITNIFFFVSTLLIIPSMLLYFSCSIRQLFQAATGHLLKLSQPFYFCHTATRWNTHCFCFTAIFLRQNED